MTLVLFFASLFAARMLSHLLKLQHVGLIDEDRIQHTSCDRHRGNFPRSAKSDRAESKFSERKVRFFGLRRIMEKRARKGETSIILEGVFV